MLAISSPELSDPEPRAIAARVMRKAQGSSRESGPAATQKKTNTPKEYKTYNYDCLPKRRGAIRLLNLFSSENDDAGVLCELITPKDNQKGDFRYEALSWCWGTASKSEYIRIQKRGKTYAKYVSPNLVAALKALRHPTKNRYLWIDMVCIDQDNLNEKNHQVEMMHDIYGNADRVLIWLGEANDSSRMALRFIKDEVSHLQSFDTLCDSKDASKKWVSLLELMQRPWFSRRWVVQEIALARKAVIYCGSDRISWKRFAIAVELFVEVETATHRLSEVMKRDRQYRYVPGWFEYVSALGASLLVDATERLFRDYKEEHVIETDYVSGSEYNSDSESSVDASSSDAGGSEYTTSSSVRKDVSQKPKTQIQPLLSLEYLVSSLTIFETTVPHDTIYALLAIAKDTTPRAVRTEAMESSEGAHYGLEVFTQRKQYNVDYNLAYVDVCKEFIQFCIKRSLNIDRSRSLDVICRPWATDERILTSIRDQRKRDKKDKERDEKRKRGREIRRSAKHTQRTSLDMGNVSSHASSNLPEVTMSAPQLVNGTKPVRKPSAEEEDMPLPSWVPQLSNAPYAMARRPGLTGPKMSRINADPLVGLPGLTQRNYSAAESKGVDMRALKFRKRTELGHFSMYVRGFLLDTIQDVEQVARNGQIPREWADLGGWPTAKGHPPDAFWRTLVADRGKDGKNPPVYYSRACEESFKNGGLESGAIDTTALINYERNSVVAQFCRRVQAVTWNRALVKTEGGRLGLVGKDVEKGDQVCILYGCSVPVILRESPRKSENEFGQELNWELKHLTDRIADCYRQYATRKRRHELRKDMGMIPLCKQWFKASNWLAKKGWTNEDIKQISADIPNDKTRTDRAELLKRRIRARLIELVKQALSDFSDWRVKKVRAPAWSEDKARMEREIKNRKAKKKHGKEKMDELFKKRKLKEHEAQRKRRKSLTTLNQDGISEAINGISSGSTEVTAAIVIKKKMHMDWWAFEYALKAGRHWRKIVRKNKTETIVSSLGATTEERKKKRCDHFEEFKRQRKLNGKWQELKNQPRKEAPMSPRPATEPVLRPNGIDLSRTDTHASEETVVNVEDALPPTPVSRKPINFERIEPGWVRKEPEPKPRSKRKKKLKSDETKTMIAIGKDYLSEKLGEDGYFSYKLLGECYIHGMM